MNPIVPDIGRRHHYFLAVNQLIFCFDCTKHGQHSFQLCCLDFSIYSHFFQCVLKEEACGFLQQLHGLGARIVGQWAGIVFNSVELYSRIMKVVKTEQHNREYIAECVVDYAEDLSTQQGQSRPMKMG